MKLLEKIILWDHFSQVLEALAVIWIVISWIRGQGTILTGFLLGWNLAAALFWEVYLWQRARTEAWRRLCLELQKQKFEELLSVAKELVEARMKSARIDPSRN